jgi:hypothetical protein
MNTARSFIEFYEASFRNDYNPEKAKILMDKFFSDFIHFTPMKIELLGSYLAEGKITLFYRSLIELKFLIEYTDNLNRYWHMLRGYSEALAKLKENQTVKNSKRLNYLYFEKYGDRRTIRNEHWFEKRRWEFLDELNLVYTEIELQIFIWKYLKVLEENFEIYKSYMLLFVDDMHKIQSVTKKQEVET